jgi:nucleoid-associated protein YgaU
MVEKAKIKVEGKDQAISVMFNPKEYAVSHTVLLEQIEKTDKSNPSFNGFTLDDFEITLIFDTYEKKLDVRKLTSEIEKLGMPTIEGTDVKRPPVCLFIWGSFKYRGVIYKIKQKFTLFLSDGTPVRAELVVTFKSVMTPEEHKKNMGIEACRKVWTVKSGDRLDNIANKALKDPALWRRIAEENNIDSPMAFPKDSDIGRTLIIPD